MNVDIILDEIELSRGESMFVWQQMESAKIMLDYKLERRLSLSVLEQDAIKLLERNGRTVPVWHISQRLKDIKSKRARKLRYQHTTEDSR